MSIRIDAKARIFATAAHAAVGQVRKYTGEPYIRHPTEVVHILWQYGVLDVHVLAAAWLHDVVEDTQVTIDLIRAEFGDDIAGLVAGMTDVSRPEDGNRAARKAIDRAHMAKQSADCQNIKLADLISNTRSIVERDPQFAKVYLAEKRLLLDVMSSEVHHGLWRSANRLCPQF